MFIGHFAAAFAAKKMTPQVSLGTLFVASQLMDLIWPVLVLAGIERVRVEAGATAFNSLDFEFYPYSHSLMMSVVWALLGGGFYFLFSRNRRSAMVVGGLILSHWFLDLIVHRPDLPLTVSNEGLQGWGLWNSVWASIVLELTLFGAGLALYLKTKTFQDLKDRLKFWSLIAFLLLIFAGSAWGPQPEEGTPAAAIAGPALAMWLFVLWAAWADREKKTA